MSGLRSARGRKTSFPRYSYSFSSSNDTIWCDMISLPRLEWFAWSLPIVARRGHASLCGYPVFKSAKKLYVISIFLIALHQIAIPMALSLALFAVVAVLAAKLVSRLKAEGADPE